MAGKKKKGKSFKNHKRKLTRGILDVFMNAPKKAFNYKQVAKKMGINDARDKKIVSQVLDELTMGEQLKEVYTGKFKLKAASRYIVGKVDLAAAGYGFIVSDETDEDIFVSHNNLHHALNGDVVKVHLYAKRYRDRLEGEVIEILERSRSTFVGIVEISRNFAFLITDNQQMPYDLFIPLDKLKGAKTGQKAIAKITDWPEKVKNPFGEIVEVIGFPGNNEVEMHAILAEFELPYRFDPDVERYAKTVPIEITPDEIKKRRDFRDVTTFTIDPADAKDFDDALSIKKVGENKWEIGVHIADVTHYLKEGTILDEEALERATSVYLVDRVVPMLPEKLSNNVCSLRPNEDKLCYSAVFDIDADTNITKQWFGPTIINSNKRFDYDEAQQIIETGKGELRGEIKVMHHLAQKLRTQRFENGAINFERVEVKFNLDDDGKPIGVFFKENKESNQLIEEFMLLANKKVAEFINMNKEEDKKRTFVYRIHDKPNAEKLENFAKFIHKFGYQIKLNSRKNLSNSINNILGEVKGKKEQNIIETLAVRSMAKAEYSTTNIGHYGLSFDHYTHFTSPIRRYPDVMVHRLMKHYINNGKSANQGKYEDMCKHSSNMERKAVEAERASIKYKQVEFMSDKLGQQFDGVISGVTEWGLFVEINENKCEGMVPIKMIDDDFYDYEEENYRLVGKSTGKIYQLGDPVKVEIWRANLAKKQLDLLLANREEAS